MDSGIPSTRIFIPLIPKFDRVPNPRIDILESCALLKSLRANNPGTFLKTVFNDELILNVSILSPLIKVSEIGFRYDFLNPVTSMGSSLK